MTLKSLVLFITTLIFTTISLGQTDNSVDVIPHWQNNDTHLVKVKSTTTDNNNGQAQSYSSTFEARYTVKEVSDSGYKVEWVYTNAKLADNEPVLENQIVARLINQKILIRFSDIGKFVELINFEEVGVTTNKVVDELITSSATNPTMNPQYLLAKKLISTKQGLEVAILKQIKFHNLSFGYTYKLNALHTNNLKYPNPLGGQAFDAVEKVELTKLDTKNSVCVIETSKVIDVKVLKIAVIDYIKKATNSNPQAIEDMTKANVEMTEGTMQEFDYLKGLIKKTVFKRTMNFGFQNRITLVEIETID